MISAIKKNIHKVLSRFSKELLKHNAGYQQLKARAEGIKHNCTISPTAMLYAPYHIADTTVNDYSYIAEGAKMSIVTVGKFCSIGPNIFAGHGIHPLDGISTSPMFYSLLKQNGDTLSATNKVEERKPIYIGNDVFIGANVTILDGVTISDGAVIGAGAVVSKDIPPYAVAVGSPIRIIRYRFDDDTIAKLLKIRWWDWSREKLKEVERNFFNIETFLNTTDK